MNRFFVLRESVHFDSLVTALKANWPAMAAAGKPLGVTVAPYRKSRSHEANALMWVWLTQIAEQAWVAGRQYAPEVWHEHMKRELLPERNARGDEKWRLLPDDSRDLVMSTTRLNIAEMSIYMEKLQANAATTLGVQLF